jgi:hypothetical protein
MGTFWVDPDALSQLANRIDSIVNALENAEQSEQGADAALGTSNLAGAYNDFIGGWSDGRKQILSNIKTLSGAASAAASAYLQAENQIKAAAQK